MGVGDARMRMVTPVLKRVVYPSLARAGVFRRGSRKGLAVVTYHGVLPGGYRPIDAAFDGNLIHAEVLREQIVLLKRNYEVVTPEDVLEWREGRGTLPPRAVLLTCDDGLLNHLTDMLPVLQQEDVKCLFFVTGASADESRHMLWHEELFLLFFRARAGKFQILCEGLTTSGEFAEPHRRHATWWNAVKQLSRLDRSARNRFLEHARTTLCSDELSSDSQSIDSHSNERRFRLLKRNEVRFLSDAGMTIGAHTMSHPILSLCPEDVAREEMAASRNALEAILQKNVWAFAYPFGDADSVTNNVVDMAKETGYQGAFMNIGGGLGADLPAYALPRIHVTAQMGLGEFEANIAGFYGEWRRRAGRSYNLQAA